MSELNPNLATFRDSFDHFDTAAHGGKADGIVSRDDLRAVANDTSGKYSTQERQAALYLLYAPEDFVMLDTAQSRSCAYADGKISREDVNAVFSRAPSYSAAATFVSDGCRIPSDGRLSSDDPAGAAAQTERIKDVSMSMGGRSEAAGHFMHVLREHQGDILWVQDYFRALGSRNTAELLGEVASPARYYNLATDYAHQQIALARETLQQMYASGALNDADVSSLVEQWALQRGPFNPGVAQLFAGMQGPESRHLQNAFFNATSHLALAPNKKLDLEDRQSLAAAGTYVLSKTSADNQIRELTRLQNSSGGDAADVGRVITLAMSQRTSVADLDGPLNRDRLPLIDYNGVTKLVNTLSYIAPPDGRRPPDSWSFNYGQLTNLRDNVFYGAANGLDANRSRWQGDVSLKDGLSRIFIADYDRMLASATADNGAVLRELDHAFPKALERFAQNVIFTEPSGSLRNATSRFLCERLGSVIHDLNALDNAAFARKYGGDPTDDKSKMRLCSLVGSLLAHAHNGMQDAMQVATDKRAAQKEVLQFFIDLAWSIGKDGLKAVPGGNVVSYLLPEEITGSKSFEAIKGKVEELVKKGATDKAVALLEELPGFRLDAALGGLAQKLRETVDVRFLPFLEGSFNWDRRSSK